ncbi:MAG: adenosylmethionine decarboxylase [Novosphingobium sp.]
MTTHTHEPGTSLHLIADIERGERLEDLAFVEAVLREAAEAAHCHVVGINLHHFGPGHGVTGIVVLAESHISIHTWPETGLVAVDIFVCGKHADAHAALDVIAGRFKGTVAFVQAIPRLGARVPNASA